MESTREFVFDATNARYFPVMWVAFGYLPQQGQSRKMDVQRREAGINRKLRSISEEVDNQRKLKEGQQTISLDRAEIELIQGRIEAFPFWNPLAEPSPVDVYDWLDAE